MSDPVAGVDLESISDWLSARLDLPSEGQFEFERVAGGFSNLTYRVTHPSGRQWVLRRPPLSTEVESAHDVGREYRILSSLGPSPFPVPDTVAFCDDTSVTGAPFFVMEYVSGTVLRSPAEAEAYPPTSRQRVGEHLVDLLADLHALDPSDWGLGELGRREDYVERQLWRWRKQWEATRIRESPLLAEVHRLLSEAVPDQVGSAIVHGDYRLDNTIVDHEGRVRAVLDWELCTLGDALADVGLLMVYWVLPGEDPVGLQPPTTVPGFPTRNELLTRYAERSGRDVSAIDFYVAFGHWKLACINEGVYARYASGAMGDSEVDSESIAAQASQRAELALEIINRV